MALDCLDVIQELQPAKPTWVMFKAGLSWNVLQEILAKTVELGLVIKEPEGFTLSDRGREVLYTSRDIERSLPIASVVS